MNTLNTQLPTNPLQVPNLSIRCHAAGELFRPPGFDSGWGRFADILIASIEGGDFFIDLEDGSQLHVPDGCGFIVAAGFARRVVLPATSSATTIYAHMECRLHHGLDAFIALRGARLLPTPLAQEIAEINRAYIALNEEEDLCTQATQSTLLGARMLQTLFTEFPDLKEPHQAKRHAPLLPVLRHIEEHLHESLSREDLATLINCSVSHLHLLFKELLGVAPMEYLRDCRLRLARRLLLTSNDSITTVAEQCGFPDAFYFSRIFAKYENMPPSQYRRSMDL